MIDEQKKLEIAERSAELFMKSGIKSVTMDDLARHLGMSKKTIYKFFKDKKELVRTIIMLNVAEDKKVCLETEQTAENAIDQMILIAKFISSSFTAVHSSVFYDLQKYHKDAWDIMDEHKSVFVRSHIEKNIERGIQEGLYRSDIKSDIIAVAYIASMDTIFNGVSFRNKQYSVSDIFVEIIRFLIRGITNETGLEYLKKRIKQEKNV
ncbi:MAG: TetR/AcrR family transcriptional regulator [Crocinitomicaceae bacterium]|nr:TetR/AcrR family transcriptional regulator [Crocinitomicaceae bacterium]